LVKAIILAAGKSCRFGGSTPKQFVLLSHQPIVKYSLIEFNKSKLVSQIVVAVSQDRKDFFQQQIVKNLSLRKPVSIVIGGKHRQDSVYNALLSLSPETKKVIIHDAARPLITADFIDKLIRSCTNKTSVIAAVPVTDTVKQSIDKRVEKTLNRDSLWLAQTPQVFPYEIILAAHKRAKQENIQATDDAALVEILSYPVKIVASSRQNLKITEPLDLLIAERIMEKRDRGF
jgi:2-C-methyl-D-erythritol 4-phosphate cytidylyltransferase